MSNEPTENTGGGFPLRALAMVLIALAVIFGAIGAFSLSGGGDPEADAPASTTTAAPPPAATTPPAAPPPAATASTTTAVSGATTTTATTTPGAADKSVPVRVLNNGTVAGQASKTGAQLKASGWNVVAMENYNAGRIPESTAYYTEGIATEKATATAIAQELGIAVKPRFTGLAKSAPGVIVIMTTR